MQNTQDSINEEIFKRLTKLEEAIFGSGEHKTVTVPLTKLPKTVTIAEIAKSEALKIANGQQKIAAIIGYYETITGEGASKPEKIKNGWIKGKFEGKYNPVFIHRAVGVLIRDLEDGSYDLNQSGETYFEEILNQLSK